MQNSSLPGTRRGLLLPILILGVVTALTLVPSQFRSEAVSKGEGLFTRTQSADPELPNYDIRTGKGNEIGDYFASARQSVGKDAVAVADVRDGFTRGEEALRSRIPTVKFEYNEDIRIPEVITPDVWKKSIEWLTGDIRMPRNPREFLGNAGRRERHIHTAGRHGVARHGVVLG